MSKKMKCHKDGMLLRNLSYIFNENYTLKWFHCFQNSLVFNENILFLFLKRTFHQRHYRKLDAWLFFVHSRFSLVTRLAFVPRSLVNYISLLFRAVQFNQSGIDLCDLFEYISYIETLCIARVKSTNKFSIKFSIFFIHSFIYFHSS